MRDLIDREAAIEAVHKAFDECLVWDESGEYTANEVETVLTGLPSANTKWFPASTPPPTPNVVNDTEVINGDVYVWHESGVVLAKTKEGFVMSAIYIEDDPCVGKVWLAESNCETIDVEKWMYMPED